jgi:hypothetical protein
MVTGHGSRCADGARRSLDLEQLDLELEGRIGGDDAAEAAFTVGLHIDTSAYMRIYAAYPAVGSATKGEDARSQASTRGSPSVRGTAAGHPRPTRG